MKVYTKENVIEIAVQQQIEYVVDTYWQGFEDMVKPQVVLALVLNQLEPHYATFLEGRTYQIKKLEPRYITIQTLVTKMIKKSMDVFQTTDQLLPEVKNISEIIVEDHVKYVLEKYHKHKKHIVPAQVEALILNKLPHHYAATARGYNELKIKLNRNKPFKLDLIKRAANIVANEPRFGTPITEEIRTSIVWSEQQKNKISKKAKLRSRHGDFSSHR